MSQLNKLYAKALELEKIMSEIKARAEIKRSQGI